MLTTTTSTENDSNSLLENEVENWISSTYFVIINSIVFNLKYSFSNENLAIANSVDSFQ